MKYNQLLSLFAPTRNSNSWNVNPIFNFRLTFESFGLSSVAPATAGYDLNCYPAQPTVPAAAVIPSEDYLLVPNAVNPDNQQRVTRLCGNTVNTRTIVGMFEIE